MERAQWASNGEAMINEVSKPATAIRRAVAEDAGGITRTFLESPKKDDSIRRKNVRKASRLSQSSVVKLLDL
jgi:hypothetical protein